MEKPSVTMSQIAEVAGVHVSTVSLALRDSPLLAAETRDRIKELAVKMGYVRDPALSALIAYRSRQKVPVYQGTLAWFNGSNDRLYYKTLPAVAEYLKGAEDNAHKLGYQLEEFWLFEPRLTAEALHRRLLARGIRGIVVFPLVAPTALLDFGWDDFSAVTLGYSLTAPQLHRITNHQFRTVLMVLHELCRLGYQRIGLSLLDEMDRRFALAPSSVYGAYSCRLPGEFKVPVHFQQDWQDEAGFRTWFERERPQAVITHNKNVAAWLGKMGLRTPEDVGLAFINLPQEEKVYSGVYQNDYQVGVSAIDLLVNLLHRNERGVPAMAKHMLVEGLWKPGRTLRNVGPEVKWMLDMPVMDRALVPFSR